MISASGDNVAAMLVSHRRKEWMNALKEMRNYRQGFGTADSEPFLFRQSSIPCRPGGGADRLCCPKTPNRLPSLARHPRQGRSFTDPPPLQSPDRKSRGFSPFRFRRVMEIQHRFQVGKYRHNHRHDELENQLRFQSDALPSIPEMWITPASIIPVGSRRRPGKRRFISGPETLPEDRFI